MEVKLNLIRLVFNINLILRNEFDQKSLFQSTCSREELARQNNRSTCGYLRQKINHSEVIAKLVVRYDKNYWIIQVMKNTLLDRIDIICYMPLTKRRFFGTLNQKDLEQLSEEFKNRLQKTKATASSSVIPRQKIFQRYLFNNNSRSQQ